MGLIAFAILIIVLLVFWIQSCQASSKTKTYKSYMTKIADIGSTSQQIGRQLGQALLTPGVKRAQLQQRCWASRARSSSTSTAHEGSPAGPAARRAAGRDPVAPVPRRGLAGLANALGAIAGNKNAPAPQSAGDACAHGSLASDVVWYDSFKGPATAERANRHQEIGGSLVPAFDFLTNIGLHQSPRRLDRLAADQRGERARAGTELPCTARASSRSKAMPGDQTL